MHFLTTNTTLSWKNILLRQVLSYPPHPWVIAGHFFASQSLRWGICLLCYSHLRAFNQLICPHFPINSTKTSQGLTQCRGWALLDLTFVILWKTKFLTHFAGLSLEAGSRRKSTGFQSILCRLLLPVLAVNNLKYIL